MSATNKDAFQIGQILSGLLRKRDPRPSMAAQLLLRDALIMIEQRQALLAAQLRDMNEEFALRDPDGKFIEDKSSPTGCKIADDRLEKFFRLHRELSDAPWDNAPTISARMLDKEFQPDFDVTWALRNFLINDLEDAAISVNGATPEAAEAVA